MKIEVWEESQKKAEQPLKLRLKPVVSGVELTVVDSKGDTIDAGHLLVIRNSGQLFLEPDINKSLGLCLDAKRRLEVIK